MTGDFLDSATSAPTPWVAIVVIGLGSLLFTANATSLHTYYRDRLAHAYLDYGATPARQHGPWTSNTCTRNSVQREAADRHWCLRYREPPGQ